MVQNQTAAGWAGGWARMLGVGQGRARWGVARAGGAVRSGGRCARQVKACGVPTSCQKLRGWPLRPTPGDHHSQRPALASSRALPHRMRRVSVSSLWRIHMISTCSGRSAQRGGACVLGFPGWVGCEAQEGTTGLQCSRSARGSMAVPGAAEAAAPGGPQRHSTGARGGSSTGQYRQGSDAAPCAGPGAGLA